MCPHLHMCWNASWSPSQSADSQSAELWLFAFPPPNKMVETFHTPSPLPSSLPYHPPPYLHMCWIAFWSPSQSEPWCVHTPYQDGLTPLFSPLPLPSLSSPAHVLDCVLVSQPVRPLDGVVCMPAPIIHCHVAQGCIDTALCCDCVGACWEQLGDAPTGQKRAGKQEG